jgi:hypothetical protein
MPDVFETHAQSPLGPLTRGFAITPSDTVPLPAVTRQLRVTGTAGTIAVVWASGEESVEPVNVGDFLDWRIHQVKATGTTATGLRGYA